MDGNDFPTVSSPVPMSSLPKSEALSHLSGHSPLTSPRTQSALAKPLTHLKVKVLPHRVEFRCQHHCDLQRISFPLFANEIHAICRLSKAMLRRTMISLPVMPIIPFLCYSSPIHPCVSLDYAALSCFPIHVRSFRPTSQWPNWTPRDQSADL